MKKRTFIKLAGTAGAGLLIAPLAGCGGSTGNAPVVKGTRPRPFLYEQEPLGYDFSALSPAIDPITMEIHYGKHHAGYVTKLNRALLAADDTAANLTLIELLNGLKPTDTALRNNGGGHYNHTLYWRTLAPGGSPSPEGDFKKELEDTFGSIEAFQEEFMKAAATRFGSGWAWLMRSDDGTLRVTSTPNQDNPLMSGIVESTGTPLLGIDVWEHAYYLNYQNNRKAYIAAFMERINWDVVASNDRA
jgi:Fe-Mn family superoxide dismutase